MEEGNGTVLAITHDNGGCPFMVTKLQHVVRVYAYKSRSYREPSGPYSFDWSAGMVGSTPKDTWSVRPINPDPEPMIEWQDETFSSSSGEWGQETEICHQDSIVSADPSDTDGDSPRKKSLNCDSKTKDCSDDDADIPPDQDQTMENLTPGLHLHALDVSPVENPSPDHYQKNHLMEFRHARRVLVGADKDIWTGSPLFQPPCPGGNVLIENHDGMYYFFDRYILRFELPGPIEDKDFITPMGNNDVPYSYIFCQGRIYMMWSYHEWDKGGIASVQDCPENRRLLSWDHWDPWSLTGQEYLPYQVLYKPPWDRC